jgi:hypothetical protein
LSLDNLEKEVKEVSQMQKALFAFLGGEIYGWSMRVKEKDRLDELVFDMQEVSKKLAEKGGVKFDDSL